MIVDSRRKEPVEKVPENVCTECGRRLKNCAVSDCRRHYHNVVVR